MENSGEQKMGEEIKNGENGAPAQHSIENPHPSQAYINLTADGWLTVKVNLAKGLYEIIGLFAQAEDTVRVEIGKAIRKAEEARKLAQPQKGFRGIKLFK